MKFLAVDPGEDCGWSLWEDNKLVTASTTKMWTFPFIVWSALTGDDSLCPEGWEAERDMMVGIEKIVCEDFRIYPDKAKDLAWDEVRTARLIGALTFIAMLHGLEFVLQGAFIKNQAKAAGAEELFYKPVYENRHQNDSIMHGWFYLQMANN